MDSQTKDTSLPPEHSRHFVSRKKRIRLEGPRNLYYDTVSDRFASARMILYLVLLVFVIVMALSHSSSLTYQHMYHFFTDLTTSLEGWDSSISDDIFYEIGDAQCFTPFRGGFAAVGTDQVNIFTATGRRTLAESHSMKEPTVVAYGKYLVVYDRNGTEVSVYNSFSRIFRETYEYTVNVVALSESGSMAVVTEDSKASSVIYVYDSRLNLVNVISKNTPVTSVTMSSDGKKCVYTTVSAVNGEYSTVLSVLEVGEEVATEVTVLTEYVYTCRVLDNGEIICVTDTSICSIHASFGILDAVSFERFKPIKYRVLEEGCLFLLEERNADFDAEKIVGLYRFSDGSFSEYLVEGDCFDIQYANDTIYAVKEDGILRILSDGTHNMYLIQTEDVSLCLCGEFSAYLCYHNKAKYLNFGEDD